jgi:hypothetical protein
MEGRMAGKMSRRFALSALGAGGLAGAIVGGAAAGASSESAISQAPTALPEALRAGTRFGRWAIAAVHPLSEGAIAVDVRGEQGDFALKILARDGSRLTARPPAETEGLAIYVQNGGDGYSPTAEEEGLAAMTLANLLEVRGEGGAIAGLLTHRDHLARRTTRQRRARV